MEDETCGLGMSLSHESFRSQVPRSCRAAQVSAFETRHSSLGTGGRRIKGEKT